MPYPVPIVEVAFDDGPYVVSPTWTDITAYVYECNITRGRDDDWSQFYGSANLVLNNRTRRFDPFYTSGPYYGKLTPRRQLRVRATHGGTTYDVFRGFVQGWPPAWTDAGTNSTVSISCFDALQLLGSNPLPVEWARSYILSTNPRHYYPCEEPVLPFSSGGILYDYGTFPMNMTLTTTASNGGRLADGLPSQSIQGTETYAATSGYGAANTNTDFTVAAWVVPDGFGNFNISGVTGQYGYGIGYEPNTGKYVLAVNDWVSLLDRTWKTNSTFDGSTGRHVAFSFNITTKAITVYIDGVAVAVTATTAVTLGYNLPEVTFIGVGQAQQFVLWTSIQTAATIQEIYNRSSAIFGETTSARVTRVIGETPFSMSLVSVPASPVSSMIGITTDAPPATEELVRAANSEYAPLFVTKAGVLTLFSQNQIRTQTTSIVSQVTYGSGGVGLGQDVVLQMDGDSLRNVANINMSKGGVYRKTNSTSVTAYGQSEATVDTELNSVAGADNVANIVTGWGGIVYPLADEVEVVVRQDGTWGSTLALELCDRVTMAVAPPSGNTITYPMLLQRIRHQIVPGRWQTFIQGSARWAAVFILDTSVLDGTDLLG